MQLETKINKKPLQWEISTHSQSYEDPLLDCLVLLSEYYGSPCSANALTAGFAMNDNILTPEIFIQASSRAGLSSKIVSKDLLSISKLLLPCVLLLGGKKACILKNIDLDNKKASIVTSETGGEELLELSELEAMYTGFTILVKKQFRGDKSVDLFLHENKTHWFWGAVKNAKPFYKDAFIASILINLFALASPLFVMNVYDKVVPNLAFESLWVLASGVFIVICFDFVMKKMRSHLIDIAGKKIDILVSSKLFARLIAIPLEKRAKSVGAMAKKLGEFESIRDILTSVTLTTLVDLPFAIFFLFVIYLFAGDLAIIPVISGLLITGFALLVQAKLKVAIDESNKYASQKHGHLIETLSSLEEIKANVAEGIVQKNWQQMTAHSANWGVKVKQLTNTVSYFAAFMVQITTVCVVILGVYRVAEAQISMGGIIAAVMLSSRAVAPMAQFAALMNKWNQTQSGLRQLNSLMQEEDEFEDKADLISRDKFKGDIVMEKMSFTYPSQSEPAIYPSDLRIQSGEKIAILGKNGGGKTTLTRLFSGLFQPSHGSLRFDGIDSKQIHPADLRKNVGYLAQDVTLFQGNIRENIMFGMKQVTEHHLIKALSLSGVDTMCLQDNEGLDKQVGERGEMLSRGQRQSIALARALLNDPPILVMDEPTASLDINAEKHFIHSMKKATKNRTLILVTHKTSLLELVDRIVVMDKGRIVMDGSRDQILAKLTNKSSGGEHAK